jgi:putative aminopeptidase FrvX
MMDKTLQLLKDLSEVNGIPGHENAVAAYIKKVITPFADEVTTDQLGSVIATKKGRNPSLTIMLSAHMDEVGFLVYQIEKSGMLRLQPVGGWWGHVLLAQVLTVTTRKGKTFTGVIGAKPPHGMTTEVRNKVIEIKDMFLDLGFSSKEQVLEAGIQIGDMVTPAMVSRPLNGTTRILGKAWDDRVSCAALIQVMERLSKETVEATVASAFTVQEEVGLRGAKTAAYKIKPDLALAVDVTMANDIPGVPVMDTQLGKGVALSVMDGTVIAHRGLFDVVEAVAKKDKIPYTYDLMTVGGTDAGEIHKQFDGVITMTLSIPSRYFHSHVSVIDTVDLSATVDLIVAFIRQFSAEQLQQLKLSKFL